MFHENDAILQYISDNSEDTVLIYGAGYNGKICLDHIGKADFFVDKNAENIRKVSDIRCLSPEESYDLPGKKVIIISMSNAASRKSVHTLYEGRADFSVFEFVETLDYDKYNYSYSSDKKLRINIVYKDDGWILGKFANKLKQQLILLGQECSIADKEDPRADINHYIAYASLPVIFGGTNTKRTAMITHVDTALKLDLIKMQTNNGVVGICMSSDTHTKLQRWGVAPNAICYINPAQDGEIQPRKIIIGITNRCYHNRDFRKRDDLILQVMQQVNYQYFKILIMGEGWDEIVHDLESLGVDVDYYPTFDREKYIKIMPQLDYWLYYGFDEGAMGYLDALAAGIKTIVTPQGYHLDTISRPTYLCSTIDDFVRVFKKISEEKKEVVDSVKEWTWENYALKHLDLWRYLTGTITLKDLYSNQSKYMDGIYSLLISDNNA